MLTLQKPFRAHSWRLLLAVLLLAGPACQRRAYVPAAHLAPVTSQPVGATLPDDPAATALISPYQARVAGQMREVLGTAPVALTKNAGESTLGNFVADLQRQRASQELGQPVDLGVITNGGLRAPLPVGPVSLEAVFELMPFENELLVLDLPGPAVVQLFEYAAHVKMAISGATYAVTPEGLPADIRIGGQPFDAGAGRRYTLAISDYLANGGDDMTFLRLVPPRHTNVLLRTAIADHIRQLTRAGQPVQAAVDGRVRDN